MPADRLPTDNAAARLPRLSEDPEGEFADRPQLDPTMAMALHTSPEPAPDRPHERLRIALGRSGGVALLAAVLVLAGFSLAQLLRHEPESALLPQVPGTANAPLNGADAAPTPMAADASATATGSHPASQQLVVSVVGLVQRPGLVTPAPGARVADALAAAGGPLPGADAEGLNLARPLADGEQIVVGMLPSAENPDPVRSTVLPAQAPAAVPAGAGATPGAPSAPGGQAADVVNLNTADATALEALPGIGPATSAAIIAHRDANGPFRSVDQLLEVEGIGPGKLEKLRAHVTV